MNKKFNLLGIVILIASKGFSQIEIVDVADLNFKMKGKDTKELYYGFAEGDEILFTFEETNGKPLKEVEITEIPSNSKFMQYKAINIVDKRIKVNQESVYKFSFKNTSFAGRICKVKIQRLPKSVELSNFNTDWEWKTLYDTTYAAYTEDSIVGYDTTYHMLTKQRLIKDELELVDVLTNHAVKVHSRYYNYNILSDNVGEYNEEIVTIALPATNNSIHRKTENVTWYYGVGINQKQKKESNSTKSNILGAAGSVSSFLGRPELKVAFNLIDKATTDNSDLSIKSAIFANQYSANKFKNDQPSRAVRSDNIVSSSSIRMNSPLRGNVYIGFENENGTSAITGGAKALTVYLNVSVWTRIREYEDYEIEEQRITARKVTLNKTKLIISTKEIRVNSE